MLPLRDHNPSNKTPFITFGLIAINVLAFIYMYYIAGTTEPELLQIYDDYALQPNEVSSGNELITLLTSIFMHGDIMHLGGNMLFLWIFGDNLEARLGHAKYLGFYLLAGLAASWAQIIANSSSEIFNLGASGAIAGVMGGYLILWPKAKIDTIAFYVRIVLPAWAVLVYWFGFQLFQSYLSLGAEAAGGVAYWAHAGGFAAGLLMILPFLLASDRPKRVFVKGHYRNRSN